jgi:uncharacterized lipoprotein YajG
MKLKQLNQIGMLLALILFSGCSKQNGQPAAGVNSSTQDASVSLLNVYSISLNGAAYLMTELQNTGKAGITAFQGKWTITDDLGATVADLEVRFTSDTPYLTPAGAKSSHVIAPGEKILIINQSVTGQDDNVFAAAKEDIGNIGNPVFTEMLKESKLDDYRVTKKTTFEVEQIVSQ